MTGRRLDAEEAALWARVKASVRPIAGRAKPVAPTPPPKPLPPAPAANSANPARQSPRLPTPPPRPAHVVPSATLDGGWDRRLSRGLVSPESMIDLHGHTLASAHAMLDDRLSRAIGRGDRVLLLVTGKPPRPESQRPHARGAIRAAVGDWLASSRHAHRIAAVRGAHPRHGGTGALYVVLRRARESR
jgi:DNA-nicking Smr family endonuclease